MSNTDSHPIVVGIDANPASQLALRWAVDEAARRQLPVRLIGVAPTTLTPLPADLRPPSQSSEARKPLEDAVSYASARLGADNVSRSFSGGTPAGVLVDESADAEMVVVGSRRQGTLSAIMMGSVSSAVAAHAESPVIVVRTQDDDPSGRPLVVGVDGSEVSDKAIAFAFTEARQRNVPVDLVHCWDEMAHVDPGVWLRAPVAELRGKVNEWLVGVADDWRAKYPDVKVTEHLVDGSAGPGLIEHAKTAQLVVVGSRGHGGIAGLLLGSVSQNLLHHAPCSVAVVR